MFVFLTYCPMLLLKFRSGELVGWGIWFHIQRVPHCILLMDLATPKTRNTNKKSSFFYDKYVNSTIMVGSFYWNSIDSWITTDKNLLLERFLIRTTLDPKFPLMTIILGCKIDNVESKEEEVPPFYMRVNENWHYFLPLEKIWRLKWAL